MVERDDRRIVTALLVLTQGVTAISAMGINLLSAFVLNPSARGELALWLQIGYLVTTLAVLGVERPIAAHSTGRFAGTIVLFLRLISPALWALAGVALLAAIAVILLPSVGYLGWMVALAAVFALGNTWVRASRTAYIVSSQWRPFIVSTLLFQLVSLSFACALALLGIKDLVWWAGGYTTASVATILMLLIVVRRNGASNEIDISERALRRRSLALLPASIGNTAMLRSERLLLPALSTSAELGIYVLVATATELASWPVQQYVDASLRKLRDRKLRSLDVIRFVALGAGIGLALAVGVAGVCWLIIDLWLPAYQRSKTLLLPLILAAAIYSGTRVQQGFLIAKGRTATASGIEIVGLISSLLMYVLLIPGLGALGAAWGSVLGYGVAIMLGGIALVARKN